MQHSSLHIRCTWSNWRNKYISSHFLFLLSNLQCDNVYQCRRHRPFFMFLSLKDKNSLFFACFPVPKLVSLGNREFFFETVGICQPRKLFSDCGGMKKHVDRESEPLITVLGLSRNLSHLAVDYGTYCFLLEKKRRKIEHLSLLLKFA